MACEVVMSDGRRFVDHKSAEEVISIVNTGLREGRMIYIVDSLHNRICVNPYHVLMVE